MSTMTTRNGPGRPREFDREQALDAAMLEFWQYGYEATSVAKLRKAMGGLSVASMYSAFGDKEALFKLSVDRYRNLPNHVSKVLRNEQHQPLEAIRQALRAAVLVQTDPNHAFGCLVLLGATNHSADNTHISDYLKRFREDVTNQALALLKRARASGQLHSSHSDETLALTFRVILNGIALQARDGASTEQLLQVVDVAETLFV